MSYSIRYLPLAVQDLDDLAAYLARFYPGTATKALREIERSIAPLGHHPKLYEVYPDNPAFRKIPAGNYLVFYKINEPEKTVDIYRILRGSWNMDSHLRNGG